MRQEDVVDAVDTKIHCLEGIDDAGQGLVGAGIDDSNAPFFHDEMDRRVQMADVS